MIIGNFNKTEDGSYTGILRSFTLFGELTITPLAEKKAERAPDYRITFGDVEIGAAWRKSSEAGNAYLSISLDDPALPAPVSCALVKTTAQEGYSLVWERRRKPKASPAHGEP